MRAAPGRVKKTGNWPPQRLRGRVRPMGKVLFLLLVAAVFAVCLVPVHGKTIWDHAQEDGFSSAAASALHGAIAWVRGPAHKRARTISADAAPAARRRPDAAPERIAKAPPKERLSPDDRASLDRLVHARSR